VAKKHLIIPNRGKMKTIFSKYLAKPKDSPEHRRFREELWLVGPPHSTKYYLSIILGRDFYAATNREFHESLRSFVKENASSEAACLVDDPQYLEEFLKQQCAIKEGTYDEKKISKINKAIILLLKHPNWSKERIRDFLKTTDKQMMRWSDFNEAMIVLKRHLTSGTNNGG
jgi:hypothetical protein